MGLESEAGFNSRRRGGIDVSVLTPSPYGTTEVRAPFGATRLLYPAQISFLPSDARLFALGLHQTRAVPQFPQEFFLQIVDGVVEHADRVF